MIGSTTLLLNIGLRAHFHYEHEMEHYSCVLLIFFFLQLKQQKALSKAKKSKKKQRILHSTLTVETSFKPEKNAVSGIHDAIVQCQKMQ